ncbi:MAG TPA: prepilin-type N-terminal cleavage/methylation domain-containing protein [Candidatus Acidoferrales bacterium]|nr:prepilin-type N-terminal cleavage/methylation domain-containing protein [Candidatus Acidoferrales bacterium]
MLSRRNRSRGFSLIELLIVITIILIIIMIAAPRLSRARMYSQETAAVAAIKTIHTAEVQYYSQFGKYAVSLTELGPPASGAAGPAAADLIGSDLSGGLKSGYKFTVTGNQGGYIVSAVPETFNVTGSRTFFSDQSMTIRQNYGQEPATANSPEMK